MTQEFFFENYLSYPRSIKTAVGLEIDLDVNNSKPVGPKDNEIWYTTADNEIYDFGGIVEMFVGAGATYNGPAVVSNEYDEEKQMWCMTFDNDVTILSDLNSETMTADGPFFVTLKSYGLSCNVETIILPKTTANIGSYAFFDCSGLTSVTIPNSVTSIGSYAFYGCTGLTSIEIPNRVTYIGSSAFQGCSSLSSINLQDCANLQNIRSYSFQGCSSLTSITIPNSITSIGEYAFSECSNLTSVTIGNSVTSIGLCAFSYCSSLTSVTIPNGVTSIENHTFSSCSSLMIVNIPDSVTTIKGYAFDGCGNLTNVILGNGVTSIGSSAFNSKLNNLLTPIYNSHLFVKLPGEYIGKYIIPSGIEKICSTAIYSITGVTSVIIPNSVTYIDYGAFTFSNSLLSITCEATTPPVLGGDYVFDDTRNCPIYVPSQSVDAYKAAENWSEYASRIQAIQ